MPFIDAVPEEPGGPARPEALYARARQDYGYLPNMFRAFSLRPEYMQAWTGLLGAIKARMDPRRYELVTLAAAGELRSSYCALAHGSVLLLGGFFNEPDLRAIAADYRDAGLEPAEVAAMDFAVAVVRDAAGIGRADVERPARPRPLGRRHLRHRRRGGGALLLQQVRRRARRGAGRGLCRPEPRAPPACSVGRARHRRASRQRGKMKRAGVAPGPARAASALRSLALAEEAAAAS